MSNANCHTESTVFTLYAEKRPEAVGVYRWRVPSQRVKGLVVEFCGHMRERGAGYTQVISPVFDYWDGYQVHVPPGTEWQFCEVECKSYQTVELRPITGELKPCPFCKKIPKWKGVERASNGGCFMGAAPPTYNSWWIECCSWAQSPHHHDPRELVANRNALLSDKERL